MIGVQAQGTWTAPAIPGSDISNTNTGNYAIYNIKADAIMGEGMNYNTEAIACRAEGNITDALAARQKFTLTVSGSTVKMVHANHTDRGVGCASANSNDVYADYASNNQWTFAASNTAPDYGNVYNLSLAGYGTLDVDDKWGGKLTIKDGKGYTDWAFIPEGSITDGSFAKWKERKAMYDVYMALVASSSTSTYASALETANGVYNNASASAEDLRAATRALIIAAADGIQQPTNVSALFTNADIQSCGSKADWSSDNIDISAGAAENHWASTAITLTQSKTDVPNGLYTLIFRGMYRTGSGDTPYFQAVSGTNDEQVTLPLMTDMASRWSVRGTGEWVGDDNNKIPNKLWRAAEGLAYEGASAKLDNFKVTGNSLTLTVKVTSTAQWVPFQGFDIIYSGPTNLALYKEVVAKKTVAEGLVASAATTSASNLLTSAISTAEAMTPSSDEDALSSALNDLNTAIAFAADCVAPYTAFGTLKTAADAIADVDYKETVSGSHTTFEDAITEQASAADNATTVAAITTATSTLKTAIKTYVNAAEPKNEGEYFDITCLIENPTFENNNATGWTGTTPNAITYGCAEFFNMNFDFYQNLTGLANGSYQLSVQAYCRPGGNGNLSDDKQAYYAYTQGINNVTAELYVNSDASRVGNIYAYTGATSAKFTPGDWRNDYECEVDGGTNYFVPNCMEGASKFFADEEVYKTDVAALVEDGNLKIGFREASKKNNQWVIFDNFRLYYYGSSKLVYYQQYLPQLKAEVTSDLANAAYDNVTGKERGDLETAKAATPASETEEAYKAVIDDIKEKQAAFKDAKTAYDALVTAKAASVITKISENIGAGVFQYNATTNNTLYSAYETCKDAVDDYTVTSSSTASAVQTLVDALNEAIDDYNNQPLKAPAADTRYYLTIVEDGKDWNGKAVTFIAGGRNDQGYYAIKYNTTPNDPNKCQALKFTAVAGEANTYKVSAVNLSGGEQYLTTGTTYGGNNDQIRTTDDASKAMKIKIEATSTENQFQLRNVAANKIIANNNNDDMYTANSCNFTIAEASQAEPNLTVVAGVNWATFMSPFAVDLSSLSSVEAYTVTDVDEGVTVMSAVSEGIIPANTPVLLYRVTTGSNYKPELSGWGTAADDNYEEGLLTGSYVITYIPANSYALQKKNGKVGFYKVSEDNTIQVGANRAYLTVPVAGAREAIFFEEDVTGINTIGEKAANTLQDLLNGADVYDLSGRKVNGPLEKGKVYIVNGNKIYVK